MQAYHNTIIMDAPAPNASDCFGLWQLGSIYTTGVSFKNNLVSVTRDGSGNRKCISVSIPTAVTLNNNAYYFNCPNSSDTNFASLNYVKYGTLAAWKTANAGSYDQLSAFADPLFVNASIADYTPSAPAINNIGANLGVATDISGVSRTINPDPGAYEFTIAACTNPPVAGIAIATINDICPTKEFGLQLSGNSYGAGQTFQWQTSPNKSTWTNLGAASTACAASTASSDYCPATSGAPHTLR